MLSMLPLDVENTLSHTYFSVLEEQMFGQYSKWFMYMNPY